MTSFFFIEFLPQLRKAVLFARNAEKVSVSCKEGVDYVFLADGADSRLVRLPFRIDKTTKPTLVKKKDYVEFTFGYHPKEVKALDPVLLSAKELDDVSSISCVSCKAELLKEWKKMPGKEQEEGIDELIEMLDVTRISRFKKVMNLPSDHWNELVDCWMCHDEDYEIARNHHRNGILKSRPDTLMVGLSFVQLHHDDVLLDTLQLQAPSPDVSHINVSTYESRKI